MPRLSIHPRGSNTIVPDDESFFGAAATAVVDADGVNVAVEWGSIDSTACVEGATVCVEVATSIPLSSSSGRIVLFSI